MARSRTMCHNYAQGVTMKTALKPFEAVFTHTNIQIEHHIGVRFPPPPPPLFFFSPPFELGIFFCYPPLLFIGFFS